MHITDAAMKSHIISIVESVSDVRLLWAIFVYVDTLVTSSKLPK